MPNQLLSHLLDAASVPPSLTYTLPVVARVLGLGDTQLLGLIKKGRLAAFKVSPRRWQGVLHDDLAAYVERVNGGRR